MIHGKGLSNQIKNVTKAFLSLKLCFTHSLTYQKCLMIICNLLFISIDFGDALLSLLIFLDLLDCTKPKKRF